MFSADKKRLGSRVAPGLAGKRMNEGPCPSGNKIAGEKSLSQRPIASYPKDAIIQSFRPNRE